jgi:hypothetical protein
MIRYSLFGMQPDASTRGVRRGIRSTERPALALAAVAAMAGFQASGQEPGQFVRVPTSYANIHAGPSTNDVPLVLAPQGTVLRVIGRRGEWIEVALSPELRETGLVMRWYEGRHDIVRRGVPITIGDEESGWMHDSTVQIVAAQR